jgi:PPP family 3-phenylpropionic acid transporter
MMAGLPLRLSLFFGALFLVHGVSLAYLPVWLDARGLTAAEIAAATSAPMLMRLLVTPGVAFAADRASAHRRMILLASLTALGLLLALVRPWPVPLTIVLIVLAQVGIGTIMPMADTITMAAVKRHGFDYGRIRSWGSLTFILAGYAAGYSVAAWGTEAVLVLMAAGVALTAAAGILLPRLDAASGAADRRLTLADVGRLVSDRRFALFLLVAGAIQSSHAVIYVFGVLHWRAQGLSPGYIATLWGIAVLAEIALFWGGRRVARIGPRQLLGMGAAAGLVRWLCMTFDPAPLWLLPLQILHAGSFAATHLGSMHWIASRVPASTAGTAQALLSTCTSGIAMAGAMLISGPLFAAFAGRAYLAMVLLCVLGLAALMALERAERNSPPLSPTAPPEPER